MGCPGVLGGGLRNEDSPSVVPKVPVSWYHSQRADVAQVLAEHATVGTPAFPPSESRAMGNEPLCLEQSEYWARVFLPSANLLMPMVREA